VPVSSAAPLRWRVRHDLDPAPSGALNMARDEAAARTLPSRDPGCGLLRFYQWARPTLSLGRNEPARHRFDPQALTEAGVDVVRRPTGGRAVLHDRELTYSVVVPLSSRREGEGAFAGPGGPRALYTRINEALAGGLQRLGVPAEVAGDQPVAPLDAGPCFDLPAPGEVIARGRKLVGSAQARIGGALLQHGSILIHDDQPRITGLLKPGAVMTPSAAPPISLHELLGEVPEIQALAQTLSTAFAEAFPGEWSRWSPDSGQNGAGEGPPSVAEQAEADLLAHHRSADWVWRR